MRTPIPHPVCVAFVAAALVALVALVAACGSTATPAPSPVSSPSQAGATASPRPSTPASVPPSIAASTAPDPSLAAPSPSIGQTDTEWGRIWDAVPASFPVHPDSTTTEIGHASSDQRIVAGSADAVATWYQSALETAGYSTEAMSGPLEDGSMVIDSVGEPLECHVQVWIRPLSEGVVIDILYGADCPSN